MKFPCYRLKERIHEYPVYPFGLVFILHSEHIPGSDQAACNQYKKKNYNYLNLLMICIRIYIYTQKLQTI